MIEEQLERIAVALEAIAAKGSHTFYAGQGSPEPSESATLPTGPGMDTVVGWEMKREHLKAGLREYGVKFKENSNTSTLQKLYAEARQKAQVAIEVKDVPAAVPAAEVPPVALPAQTDVPVTREATRDALVNLSAAKGKDIPLGILQDVGKAYNATKLADIKEEDYGKIVDACTKAMEVK